MFRFATLLALFIATLSNAQTVTVDFEDLTFTQPGNYSSTANPQFNGNPPSAAQSYDNGLTLGTAVFTSRGAIFNTAPYSGWLYSNVYDPRTAGFTAESAAYHVPITGPSSPTVIPNGADGSSKFGVAYVSDLSNTSIVLPIGYRPGSIQITNNTYAALSMLNGDMFAKKFGGATGNDPDFLKLTITGKTGGGANTGSVDFYLADYRFSDNSLDYIVAQWTAVDLSNFGSNTTQLTFAIASSDVGNFGINTPTYFAADNLFLTPVPEPGSILAIAAGAGLLLRWRNRRKK